MGEPKKAETQEQEVEIRSEGDYEISKEEYDGFRKDVDDAVDMIETPFWLLGFKERRSKFDKTHKKLQETVEEKPAHEYDSVEDMKALSKAKLEFTNAVRDFDNYTSDVQDACDRLDVFCQREDLPLFSDMELMTARFVRKSGKIKLTVFKNE